MMPWVLLICIDPSFLGCSVVVREYYETKDLCVANIKEAKLADVDRAWCEYDPKHER